MCVTSRIVIVLCRHDCPLSSGSHLLLPLLPPLLTCTFAFIWSPLPEDGAVIAPLTSERAHGVLQSPNFPAPYPRETRRHWNISVPNNLHVQLYFSHFDLEPSYLCEYDFVKVRAPRSASHTHIHIYIHTYTHIRLSNLMWKKLRN